MPPAWRYARLLEPARAVQGTLIHNYQLQRALVRIDLEKCDMSGECYYSHPQLFETGGQGEALLKVKDSTAPDLLLHARQAAEVCPSGAILLEE